RIPDFFETRLKPAEEQWVQEIIQKKTEEIRGKGIKLQYFASRFPSRGNIAYLFLYLTQTGKKMQVEEYQHK
ncbi:hypothetical protein GWN42_12985, partial [candidate division KSB1 bacterium]|nr:hypothetical protein [candidate division KSB1 bacterium]